MCWTTNAFLLLAYTQTSPSVAEGLYSAWHCTGFSGAHAILFYLYVLITHIVCSKRGNIKSQKKRVLTNEKAHLRNVAVKTGLKTAIRATREAIAAGDKAAAEAAYKVAAQKLDKAAGAGVIHKNQAANRKSGLAVAINAL